MKRGISPGHDGLSKEHLQHAGVHLRRVLAMLFSFCIGHSYLPQDLMKTVVVPIIKNRTGEASDKSKYRPISLATV
ncbi:RNA-directed DNA polymerase from mobile element jockey, partial [Operophtera brumata]